MSAVVAALLVLPVPRVVANANSIPADIMAAHRANAAAWRERILAGACK